MPREIHPTAIIAPGAQLAEDVSIGPFCIVGPGVVLQAGVTLHSHVVIEGKTTVGARTRIFPFAVVGNVPQDLKFRGEDSALDVGEDTTIREHVTINLGTAGGGMTTRVGDRCLLMAGCHVAHDCVLGNNVILVNHATLGGHVAIGDFAIVGGLSAVHQFVRIGAHAMIGGLTGVERDVIPYGMVIGERGYLAGLNLVGLKRRNFPREEINDLRAAFRDLFKSDDTKFGDRLREVAESYAESPLVSEVLAFISADTDRQILQPRQAADA